MRGTKTFHIIRSYAIGKLLILDCCRPKCVPSWVRCHRQLHSNLGQEPGAPTGLKANAGWLSENAPHLKDAESGRALHDAIVRSESESLLP